MSKQKKPIRRNCQHKDCVRDAIIGVYHWEHGETDVNLDRPSMVVCGEHKRAFDYRKGQYYRNVRLIRS